MLESELTISGGLDGLTCCRGAGNECNSLKASTVTSDGRYTWCCGFVIVLPRPRSKEKDEAKRLKEE
jgi:hypothetical protein